jgi:hypothetical protein
MRWAGSLLAMGLLLGMLIRPTEAGSETQTDLLAQNRSLLEKWRGDPEHYARLRSAWRASGVPGVRSKRSLPNGKPRFVSLITTSTPKTRPRAPAFRAPWSDTRSG